MAGGIKPDPGEVFTLTAIRGIAALWVILFHYSRHVGPEVSGIEFVGNGYIAVDLFFYLSGFILTHVYVTKFEAQKFDFADFLVKRFARLYPVHFATTTAVVLIWLAAHYLDVQAPPESANFGNFAASIAMLHAWGLTEILSFNYPSWSISAEMFAYLLFPVLLGGLLKFGVKTGLAIGVIALAGASLLAPVVAGRGLVELTYDFGILRILPEFLLGAAIYLFVRKIHISRRWAWGLLMLTTLLSAGLFTLTDRAFLGSLGFPVIIALLFVLEMQAPRDTGGIPAYLAPVVYLGRISYSLYMVHTLVELTGFKLVELVFGHAHHALPVFWLPIMIGASILAAHILYVLIEKPGRRAVLGLYQRRFGHKGARA